MAKKKKDTVEFRFYEIPQQEAALVLCGESWIRVYGHDEFHLHFHNLMEIGICRQGLGDMYMDEEVLRYKDGDITLIPENYPHITISDGEEANYWEYIFIDVKSIVEELFPGNPVFQAEAVSSLSKRAIMTNDRENPVLNSHIDGVIREFVNKNPYYQKAIKLHIEAIIIELLRRYASLPAEGDYQIKGTNMSQIAAALDFINKNYNQQMKAAQLAEICNMSETHFRRIFESYINMSPMDYVNLIRIQKACEFMKKTNDSMDTIASKCGFTTTSTFNRNFRKFLDTSPYQWKINPENYEHKLLNYRISALKGW